MESNGAKQPEFLAAEGYKFQYHQKTCRSTSNLDLLSYGTFTLVPGAVSDEMYHHREEIILFCLKGQVKIFVEEQAFELSNYDTLYIPLATAYTIENISSEPAFLVVCKAQAQNKHKPFYSSWKQFSSNESRIRHLKGKDVFLMFDVTEKADKLIAGYTIYEPYTRAWPAHNHTDQEEVYIFTKGKGAMEVYADEEHKTFVQPVGQMDAVSIPLLNFHPVFSQSEELHFIWCIAGERYWVGDKDKDFMKGDSAQLTT
jgi:mannose-6-phosphate isomerase-like protein (cupin superfamily)